MNDSCVAQHVNAGLSGHSGGAIDVHGSPFGHYTVDLSDAAFQSGGRQIDATGYGLLIRRTGSDPLVRVDVELGGVTIPQVAPGTVLKGKFSSFHVRPAAADAYSQAAPQSGSVRLVVLRRPDVEFVEPPAGAIAELVSVAYTATAEAATPTNAPDSPNFTDATLGLSLAGLQGFRVIVGGEALSGGEIRLWYYDAQNSKWCKAQSWIPDGSQVSPDFPVYARTGRVYAELIGGSADDETPGVSIQIVGVREL